VRLRFVQDEVLRVLFQTEILFHYATKVQCFAGYQNAAITILLHSSKVEYFLLRRMKIQMCIK